MHEITCDGVNAFVFKVKDEGKEITLSGWNRDIRNLKVGTKLLISNDGGGSGSPYIVIGDNNPTKPKDQYFLYCKFNPRIK